MYWFDFFCANTTTEAAEIVDASIIPKANVRTINNEFVCHLPVIGHGHMQTVIQTTYNDNKENNPQRHFEL
jgi:hypothetical protein